MYNVFVISGGTGFIGSRLTTYLLANNKKVFILSRQKKESNNPNLQYIQWNPAKLFIEKNIDAENVCVIHLAGAGVAEKKWSADRKKEIIESRTQSSAFLRQLIAAQNIKAAKIISASAIGIYAASNTFITEDSAQGTDYLATTCIAWEASVAAMKDLHIPICIFRIGLVMGANGGAIKEFIKTMRFHIAGIPGNGKQLYSWIHIDDMIGLLMHAANTPLQGVYNAVSPQVVSCKTLITSLAKAYCKWYLALPSPSFAIQLLLGEMSTEVLKSASISSKKIQDTAYTFTYPTIDSAMQQIANDYKK